MNVLDNFWIDENNQIQLNKHVIVVRDYKTLEKNTYDETTYYLNDESYKEWMEQLIPKHQLNELISDEELDTSKYKWMEGIQLQSDNHIKEIEQIASYGSLEVYQSTLPENQALYQLDLDYRLSKVELGI